MNFEEIESTMCKPAVPRVRGEEQPAWNSRGCSESHCCAAHDVAIKGRGSVRVPAQGGLSLDYLKREPFR